jgi:hypothetical protein
MKKTKIIYWILTGLIGLFMLFSGVNNAMVTADSITLFKTLGYPEYLIAFVGVAKILGSIVILIPGLPRLKEWAYAGLTYDLIGAMYSIIALGAPFMQWSFFILALAVLAGSYIYHHKLLKEKSANS